MVHLQTNAVLLSEVLRVFFCFSATLKVGGDRYELTIYTMGNCRQRITKPGSKPTFAQSFTAHERGHAASLFTIHDFRIIVSQLCCVKYS